MMANYKELEWCTVKEGIQMQTAQSFLSECGVYREAERSHYQQYLARSLKPWDGLGMRGVGYKGNGAED